MPSFKYIALSALVVSASAHQVDTQRMVRKVRRSELPAGLGSLPGLNAIPVDLPTPKLSLLGGAGGPSDVLGGLAGGSGGGPLSVLSGGGGPLSALTGILSGDGHAASASEGTLTKRNLADLFAPIKDDAAQVGSIKRDLELASPLSALTAPLAGLTAPLANLPLVGELTELPILGNLLGGI